jgi:hypothetical protein
MHMSIHHDKYLPVQEVQKMVAQPGAEALAVTAFGQADGWQAHVPCVMMILTQELCWALVGADVADEQQYQLM